MASLPSSPPRLFSSLAAFFDFLSSSSLHHLGLFGLESSLLASSHALASEPFFQTWQAKGGLLSTLPLSSPPPNTALAPFEAVAFLHPPASVAQLHRLSASASAIFFPKAWLLDTPEEIALRAKARHLLTLVSGLTSPSPSPSKRPQTPPRSSSSPLPTPPEERQGLEPSLLLREMNLPHQTSAEKERSLKELETILLSLVETGDLAPLPPRSTEEDAPSPLLLRLLRPPQPSRALSFWMAAHPHRSAILHAYAKHPHPSDAIRDLLSSSEPTAAVWEFLGTRVAKAESLEEKIESAAEALASLEETRSPTCLLFWEMASARLEIPGLSARELSRLLPDPLTATPGMLASLRSLARSRKTSLASRPWREYLFSLPSAVALPEIREPFLRHASPLILQASEALPVTSLLPLFLHYAPPAGASLAWALHLSGRSEEGLRLLKSKKNRTPEEEDRLAHIALAIPKQLYREKSPWLRWLIQAGPGASSPLLHDRVYRILADRKELQVNELYQLAVWAEDAMDTKRAYTTRCAIQNEAPDDPANLAALSGLALRLGKLEEHLQWAFQATRKDPRRYPMDLLLRASDDLLFSDLPKLRTLLIDLPALPAVSKIEEELTQREDIARLLASQLRSAEAAFQASTLQEARQIAASALQAAGKRTPPRFLQILQAVDQAEEAFKQEIAELASKPPADPRIRTARLEAISQEAASKGFLPLAQEALQTLTKLHPQYGLGHLALARLTRDPALRIESFTKAVQLAKSPEHRRKNLTEMAHALDKLDTIETLLPSLLPVLQAHPDEADGLEDLLLLIIEKRGALAHVSKPIQTLLQAHPSPSFLKRAREAFDRVGSLDPWKRTLMSVKLRKAAT